MTKQPRELSRKKRFLFYLVVFLIPATTISAIYVIYTGYRTAPIYWYVKRHERGWKGKVARADAELGFAPIPDSQGAEVFPIGDDVPARYDKDGFRVPLEDGGSTLLNQHPIVLTLGDSFTYGAATLAENTYPYLVGQYLEGTARNAGVCGSGLSQMMVLAKRLVPNHKPDYLLVQYSPWLVDRAQSQFAPTYFGKVPTPYFFVRQNELVLHPPVFMTKIMDLPIDRYRNTPASVIDRGSFLWNVGLPLFVHDDFNMPYYYIRSAVGAVPEPATNPEQTTKYVYEEIAKVARANGAKLVIVILGFDDKPVQITEGLFPPDSIIVNAHNALLEHLPVVNAQTYFKLYGHWRGSPPVLVDLHPNENAHRIIAEAIVHKIQDRAEMQPNNRTQSNARQPVSGR
jgi:hypothetical protein